MPSVLPRDSLWDRWWKGVSGGWGNVPGGVKKGLEGNLQPPTVKNKGLVPGSPAASAEGAVSDVGHFLGKLTEADTWVRVGEVLVGVILLSVGIDHMFNTNLTANGVAKAAPYLM